MSNLKLNIAFMNYDRTRALIDGTIKIDGVDASFTSAGLVSDIFERMVRGREFDVAELGLSFYLRTLDFDDPPFIAIPVFPNRQFRHSAIFTNTSSGIKEPKDLEGKTIGEFAMYGHDAGVVAKGILADEYGVNLDQCRWIIGGFDQPIPPFDFVPQLHPAHVDVRRAPAGKALGPMLEAGEIDAFISADVPQCVLNRSPKVARLFPDYEQVEREYYSQTGIFPIMHTVVMRKELVAQHPGLARAIYQGFCDARDVATKRYQMGMIFNHIEIMLPWFSRLFDEDFRLFADNWWPYGVEKNRAPVDAFLRYHFEQGLSKQRLMCEDIFVPELHET